MSETEPRTRMSRLFLMALLIIAPVFGSGATPFTYAVVASLLAYDGLNRHTVYGLLGVLVGAELLFGMDVGVVSVSYAATILLFMLAGRAITIPVWSAVSGWHIMDAVKSFIVAAVYYAILTVGAVVSGTVLYGYDELALRLRGVIAVPTVWFVLFGIMVMLILLRRIDQPFRRRILFGT